MKIKHLCFTNYIIVKEEQVPYTDIIPIVYNMDELKVKQEMINRGFMYAGEYYIERKVEDE